MRKAVTIVLVLAVVLLAALALNPGPDKHRARIVEAMGERNAVVRALGIAKLTAFVSSYHSLGIASYTKVNGRTTSWGAFGLVVVPAGSEAR